MDRSGMWLSDYRQIKAGSFLKANGGYLVLNARDFLIEVGVWPTLKRSLRDQVLEMQTDPFSFLFTTALKPEKIPIKVRVIVVGDPEIYELLHWYDEDFRKTFKIKADFDLTMPNNETNIAKLVGFVARICSEEELLACDPSGVEEIARLATRWAGRKKKLTARFELIAGSIARSGL